jgi:hypothetical protein
MKTAALTTTTIDPFGAVNLKLLSSSRMEDRSRRTSRVRTLDGGVALNDGGYAPGDRDIYLVWRTKPAIDDAIKRLVELYSRVNVATPDGMYRAALDSYSVRSGKSTLKLLVLSELT